MINALQKASMWKRVSAYIFDFIMLGIVIVGAALLLSGILGYDRYNEQLESAYDRYEQQYGVSFDITEEEYLALSQEQKDNLQAASAALSADSVAGYAYTMMLNLTLIIITFSILLGYLLLELLVPLLLKNGQTLGKKIFGIAVMRTDGVRINSVTLFVRTILGKYTIETMIPVLILIMIFFNVVGLIGGIILLLILALQIIMMITTHTNSAIHDLISNTVAVDISCQMIFDTPEALLDYKKRLHAERVENQQY